MPADGRASRREFFTSGLGGLAAAAAMGSGACSEPSGQSSARADAGVRDRRRESEVSIVDKAIETQLRNIQAKTGKTLDQLAALLRKSGLTRHGELRDMLKRDLGLGHGDATAIVHACLKTGGASAAAAKGATTDDVLAEIYAGPKAGLRPIHDALMKAIGAFGEFEIAPKKGYVSLRRKKQFAMIGPGTKTRVDVGINMKGVKGTDRLIELPAGGMCQFKVAVTETKQIDKELVGWVKQAFDDAG
jgi:hypothetical protein